MELDDYVRAIRTALEQDREEAPDKIGAVLPIKPFRASNYDGDVEFDVVGIAGAPHSAGVELVFVVIKKDADGSVFPAWEEAAWPVEPT